MKNILTIILFALIFEIPGIAQSKDSSAVRKNEIGLTILDTRVNCYYEYNDGPCLSYLNGIFYKRNFGKNALRLGLLYQQGKETETIQLNGTTSFSEIRGNVGWQITFGNRMVQPYFAADIIYIYTDYHHEQEILGHYSYENADLIHNGLGIANVIGTKVRILRFLSISAETTLERIYLHKKGTAIISNEMIGYTSNPVSYKECIRRIEPLRLSINIAF